MGDYMREIRDWNKKGWKGMNLAKLFEMQKELDEHITREKGLEGRDLLPQKILALQVELGELANEWRGFKFWSEDREPRRKKREKCPVCNGNGIVSMGEGVKGIKVCPHCDNHRGGIKTTYPLLEEYVDCLHFILSIGLELNFTDIDVWKSKEATTTNQFIECFGTIYNMHFQKRVTGEVPREMYEYLFACFIGLGEMLGLTWEQIEQAYLEKNAVNHQRQEEGY